MVTFVWDTNVTNRPENPCTHKKHSGEYNKRSRVFKPCEATQSGGIKESQVLFHKIHILCFSS